MISASSVLFFLTPSYATFSWRSIVVSLELHLQSPLLLSFNQGLKPLFLLHLNTQGLKPFFHIDLELLMICILIASQTELKRVEPPGFCFVTRRTV